MKPGTNTAKKIWTIAAISIVLLCCAGMLFRHNDPDASTRASTMAKLPSVVLWAWERPENLDFIQPQKVAVAFLAKTISLRGDRQEIHPRLQPLVVATGARMIAVARIESLRATPPSLSESQLDATVDEISQMATLPGVVAVQIDFDATRSEREFYRKVIRKVRERLPAEMPLSITALASWCMSDDWLSNLPIDEAVPMLFRMGVDRYQILSQIQTGVSFTSKLCRSSAGVSTDEPVSLGVQNSRLYIFSPKSWSATSFNSALEVYQR